jgi:hypothetical protein
MNNLSVPRRTIFLVEQVAEYGMVVAAALLSVIILATLTYAWFLA